MAMTAETWEHLGRYSQEVFGSQDGHLAGLMGEAVARGLPDIAVSADVGRLLGMLTALTRRRLALELGTLGGYSGIWIARALGPGGRLITIEVEPTHADFAQVQFERAGVADRVEIRRGPALGILPELAAGLPAGSVDLVFIDALKTEYPDYWRHVRPLVAPGGVVVADNVLFTAGAWIDRLDHPSRRAVDELNRLAAADPEFDAVAVPMRAGLLVAVRRS